MAATLFSKSKHKKKEKYGVVKEANRVIESTPVAKDDLAFYAGNYWCRDLRYKIEIRLAADKSLLATLSVPGKPDVPFKSPGITDAYFAATRTADDGTDEKWEGVFLRMNDNGNEAFGLGIKPAKPVPLTEGSSLSSLFFTKVSP